MTKHTYQPFWFSQALEREKPAPAQPLNRDINVDVCIVGGGYTGLWTAIQLKQKKPTLTIAIVERDLCGAGASGRNGGSMHGWSTKFNSMEKLFGKQETIRLIKASEQAMYSIRDFCVKNNIDADCRLDGTVYGANNKAQMGSMDDLIVTLEDNNINSWTPLTQDETRKKTKSDVYLSGYFSPHGGSIQPGYLVRGLRRVAIDMGIDIYEKTPMTALREQSPALVETAQGTITANKVVLALNSYTPEMFKQFNKTITVVSSDMVITKPAPDILKKEGYDHGMTTLDSRTFVHYQRTTSDGRMMLGKGGNTFAFNNKITALFNQESIYAQALMKTLGKFYPPLKDVPMERSWTGPSDRAASGSPFFGHLNGHDNILYGLGYSGSGIVQSYVGGQFLSAMVLEEDNEWTNSPMAKGFSRVFPPEPFRWVGAMIIRNAIRRNEWAEDHDKKPKWWDLQLAKLANFAAKSDK